MSRVKRKLLIIHSSSFYFIEMKTSLERFSHLSQGTPQKLTSDSTTDAAPPTQCCPHLHERGCRSFFLRLFLFWLNWVFIASCRLFSSCGEWKLLSSCGVQASHCSDFSCGAQALGHLGFSSCGAWA